jgi:hypothetical protein
VTFCPRSLVTFCPVTFCPFTNIYTQRFRKDFAFKWCQIAREWLDILEVIGCWTWNWHYFLWNFKLDDRKHQFTPPHQSLYAMPNHLPIICQNLIIWKLLLSEQLEFWKARSLKNGYDSPREKKWMDIWYWEYRIAERGVGT